VVYNIYPAPEPQFKKILQGEGRNEKDTKVQPDSQQGANATADGPPAYDSSSMV
jgi:hypothetical protein